MPGKKSKTPFKLILKGRFARFKSKKGLRMLFVKTPGGKTVVHFKRKKPNKAKCSQCNRLLLGVPRELPSKMRNLPKTKKRPERPYGGVLCSLCTRELFKRKARTQNEFV